MSIPVLTTLGTVMCPHGGTVKLDTSQSDVEAEGGKVILVSDEHEIVGCPFQIPTPPTTTPQPCTKLRWQVGALATKVNDTAVVTQTAVGLCYSATEIPQGPAVIVNAAAQTKAT